MTEQQDLIRDLHENTRKTDRNAILLALIFAFQTIAVAGIENRMEQKEESCRAKIGLINQSD